MMTIVRSFLGGALLPPLAARNMSTLEAFTEQVEAALDLYLPRLSLNLATHLDHTCQGVDIHTCDPAKPLFFLGAADSDNHQSAFRL